MIKKYNIIFFFLVTAIITGADFPQKEAITKTVKAEKGGTLEVKLNPGDVSIRVWDRNEVLVEVDGLDDDESDELRITERNGNVKVTYEGKWGWGRSANYYFTIPSTYNVDVYTTGGDVDLHNNIDGYLNVQTMGGDIDLQSVNGDVNLETMGGDITLEDVGGKSYISTHGGDIKIGKLLGITKEIKTMGGDITINTVGEVKNVTTYGGDILISKATKNIELTTFGGDIEVLSSEEGVKAETYGGSILISGASGLVDVSSGGGNITLKNISGAVRARTGAGDIHVELKTSSNRESDIRTASGDIELYVLAGSKMTINAQVDSYWGDGKGLIKSDYEGTISKNRGDVDGEFKVNGGGAEVKLRVTNGSILIKKK